MGVKLDDEKLIEKYYDFYILEKDIGTEKYKEISLKAWKKYLKKNYKLSLY